VRCWIIVRLNCGYLIQIHLCKAWLARNQ
jgi:hypothetical protein